MRYAKLQNCKIAESLYDADIRRLQVYRQKKRLPIFRKASYSMI